MGLLDRFRRKPGSPYREPAPVDDQEAQRESVRRLGELLQAQALELHELRRRLAGTGAPTIEPVVVADIRRAADHLEDLARGREVHMSTVKMRYLAASLRALLAYGEPL